MSKIIKMIIEPAYLMLIIIDKIKEDYKGLGGEGELELVYID